MQQNNKGGFQDFLPSVPSPSAFSQVFFWVFMKCLNSKAIKMHFWMEQILLTVPRLSKMSPALHRRPSLSLMPAFPCAVFCFVCAFSFPCTNMLVQCPLFPYGLPWKPLTNEYTCTCVFHHIHRSGPLLHLKKQMQMCLQSFSPTHALPLQKHAAESQGVCNKASAFATTSNLFPFQNGKTRKPDELTRVNCI